MSATASTRRVVHRLAATVIATGVAGVALAAHAPAAGATDRAPAVAIVPFAGDVDTLGSNGNLIAVDPRSTADSATLFNFQGSPLGLTWGQWRSATATSLAKTIRRRGTDYTDIRLALSGLIPGGVYSLFYRTFGPDSANPLCPAVDPLIALTARHPERQSPDADSFVADSSGGARFHARVAGPLLDAQSLQIAVIYHFDGHVYGPVPDEGEAGANCRSSLGIDAMRQFIIIQTSP
jgi:hypothetical protein